MKLHNRVAHKDTEDDCTSLASSAPPFPSTESNTDYLTQVPPNLYDDCTQSVHDDTGCKTSPKTETTTSAVSLKQPADETVSISCSREELKESSGSTGKEEIDEISQETPLIVKEDNFMDNTEEKESTFFRDDGSLLDSNVMPTSEETEGHSTGKAEDTLTIESAASTDDIGPERVTPGIPESDVNLSSETTSIDKMTENKEEEGENETYVEEPEPLDKGNGYRSNTEDTEISDGKEKEPEDIIDCPEETFEIAISKEGTMLESRETRGDTLTPIG
ncbi:uncharacterized protein LOC132734952 [Ruditapes philippinarum]|uniref:uncharacterized protein LOC132734952 n=1 Tax=Ruditapes philippinarum TaxID=129788 RepID=UPI00295A8ED8|nr:uncharacterized protein LOC132734952 [Ruditapes philippinarum]